MSDAARIQGKNRRGYSGGIAQRVASLVLAIGRTFKGVARATGGYRYLASNTPSDFIFVGLSIRLKNNPSGVSQRGYRGVPQKETPTQQSEGGVIWVYPAGLSPIIQSESHFVKKKAQNCSDFIFIIDLQGYNPYTCVVGLDKSSTSRQFSS